MTRRDINADGVDDYIFDHGHITCGGDHLNCGSAGCLTQVYVSEPDGKFRKVLDENVQEIAFKTIDGRPAMVLDLHGTYCNRQGYLSCSATLYWDGDGFSPAN